MIKLILEFTQKNLFKCKKSDRSPQKSLRISSQSVLVPRKISGIFYANSSEKYMEFEEKSTRNLKEKHKEFFTQVPVFLYGVLCVKTLECNTA
jgi:hypothetical protein